MKRTLSVVFFTLLGGLASACIEENGSLTGARGAEAASGDANGGLQCTAAPEGRAYVLFGGAKVEEGRENENIGVNRARVKPFGSMEREFQRVLGVVPPSLKDSAGSFDVPPARWFGETEYSAVSLHAMSSISYEACLVYTKKTPAFAAAPTEESALTECTNLMRKAWSRSPSPDEVSGCVALATTGLADEKDVSRRWAYTCASVMSASQFLTF